MLCFASLTYPNIVLAQTSSPTNSIASGVPLNQPGLSPEVKKQFTSHYVRVNGVRLHYVMGGSGEPLLLIPGWPESWYAWRHIMPELAQNYTVIAVDPRGVGDSDKADSGYDFDNLATDMAQLMEQIGYDSYRVVGHDVGMWIGYAVAAKYTERVSSLAVIEAVIPGVADAPTIFQPPAKNEKIWHFMFNQLSDLPETLIEGKEREYLKWLFDNKAYRTSAISPIDLDEYVRIYSIPGSIRSGFEFYRAIPQSIKQAQQWQQQKLPMPVLAIGGSESTATGPLETMKKVADNVSGGQIQSCGHYLPEECPEELLQRLNKFMGE